jgi:peptide chain release factor subunit 1
VEANTYSTTSEGIFTLIGDDERGYDFVTMETLRPLQEIHLQTPGVMSLFLDITPQRLGEIPLEKRIDALAKRVEDERLIDKRERKSFEQALQRVLAHLRFEFQPAGRGFAAFSAPEVDLWRAYHLPVSLDDRLVWADHAYMTPLFMLMDEYERYGVVLVDRERGRFFLYYLNEVAEYGIAVWDHTPSRSKDRGPGQLRHLHWLEEKYKQHLRNVVDITAQLFERERWPWLVLGGVEENTSALMKELPDNLQERLAGNFTAPVTANFNEIRDRVGEVERGVEEKVEAERVEAVIVRAHKGEGGTLGLPDTLLAVQQGRVHILVTLAGFHQRGWRCQNCGGLTADLPDGSQSNCPYCGNALIAEEDIIDLAMQVVAGQGGNLEVVRSSAADRLSAEGSVGALLRY